LAKNSDQVLGSVESLFHTTVSCPPEVHPLGVVKERALAKGAATTRAQRSLENIMDDEGRNKELFAGGEGA